MIPLRKNWSNQYHIHLPWCWTGFAWERLASPSAFLWSNWHRSSVHTFLMSFDDIYCIPLSLPSLISLGAPWSPNYLLDRYSDLATFLLIVSKFSWWFIAGSCCLLFWDPVISMATRDPGSGTASPAISSCLQSSTGLHNHAGALRLVHPKRIGDIPQEMAWPSE